MARMKKQNERYKINKLAKLKTRKGSLGKNEHPDGLTTFKGNSGKNRGNEKNLFPGGLKIRKGDPGNNGMTKKQTKANVQKALTTDTISKVCSTVERPAIAVPSKSFTFYKSMNGIWLPALNNGLDMSSNDDIPKRGTFASICQSTSHYVPNIPMFCPSLRNYVYKLPIIIHFKAFIHA